MAVRSAFHRNNSIQEQVGVAVQHAASPFSAPIITVCSNTNRTGTTTGTSTSRNGLVECMYWTLVNGGSDRYAMYGWLGVQTTRGPMLCCIGSNVIWSCALCVQQTYETFFQQGRSWPLSCVMFGCLVVVGVRPLLSCSVVCAAL